MSDTEAAEYQSRLEPKTYGDGFKPGWGHHFKANPEGRCWDCEARWGSDAAAKPCYAQPQENFDE